MMRSMFSGVSGLKGHQTRMDVIGNNIANVNTTGFKSGRVTFADMISQNLSGASAPNGNIGGTNPKQVGLGMNVAGIDTIFTNGSVQSTGKNTDVAIQGNGLFVMQRGQQKYYTRNGAFSFDAEGNLVLPSSGLYVQGYMARNGIVSPAGDNTTNIKIPAGKSMEATATGAATYTKNLNASTEGYPVRSTLVRYADGSTETTPSYTPVEAARHTLRMTTGEKIKLNQPTPTPQTAGSPPSGTLYAARMTNVTANGGGTIHLNAGIKPGSNPQGPKLVNGGTTLPSFTVSSGTYALDKDLPITGTISGVTLNVPSPGLTRLTLTNTSPPNAGITSVVVPTPTTFTYSVGMQYAGALRVNSIQANTGAYVATADGNRIKLKTSATPAFTTAAPNFTCQHTHVNGNIEAISRTSGYKYNGKFVENVTVNTSAGTALPGLIGKDYATGNTFYPSFTSMVKVYDSLGAAHEIPLLFTKKADNRWEVSLANGTDSYAFTEADGTTTTVSLAKRDLTFDTSGAYKNGSASLTFNYENGAQNAQQVGLGLGAITQYSGTTTVAGETDGNAAGKLTNVEIDKTGVITGVYSNGMRQKEAQIAFAQFNNTAGLTKMGGSLYQESNNSGTRTISGASDIGLDITPGGLEMSNVDIADQFSDMIVTQRGFQSNSKIITVSDEMLETLIGMKR